MPQLDFSGQADPVKALDFSNVAEPVRKVGVGEMAARQFVGGGADLLKALDTLGAAIDPGRASSDAMLDQVAKTSPDVAQALALALHPAAASAAGAHAYADLTPGETPDGLGARVSGGIARSVPNLAGALATGGGASLESLVPAAAQRVPLLGRLLMGLARGAPTAAAATGTQVANLPDTLTPEQKLAAAAESAGVNLAMAGLPMFIGSGPLLRTASGAAIGAGIPSGLAALHGQPQDAAENIVGAFTGAALAQHGSGREAMDPYLRAYRDSAGTEVPNGGPPRGLPRGADYSARAEPVRPSPSDLGGTVHVDQAGTAATPAQGADALAQAIQDALAQRQAPQLEKPVVAVDNAGNAATTADQHAALQPQAPDPGEAMLAALGLTPDVRRAQLNDPRVPRDGPAITPRALPSPSVTVDAQGVARTSRDYLDELRAQIEAAQTVARARQARHDMGLTPDIERTQRDRWEAQRAAELDNQATLDARAASDDELAQQGQDDTPPWWMAAHGAELDHAAAPPRTVAAPAPVHEEAPEAAPAFSFAGERARTADRAALERAKQMEVSGRDSAPDEFGDQPGSPENTHTETGWHRGTDGQWRFEIDDSQAQVHAAGLTELANRSSSIDEVHQAMSKAMQAGDQDLFQAHAARKDEINGKAARGVPLSDVLEHRPLFDAYPDLAAVRVRVNPEMRGLGAYSPSTNVIELRSPDDYPSTGATSVKSVLLHEIQHAIQNHEGFARGGSASEFARPRMAERDDLNARIDSLNRAMSKASNDGDKPAYERLMGERREVVRQLHEKGLADDVDIQERAHRDYSRLAGEVEARNTQRRLEMNEEDRRATPPTETADVPRAQQIVRVNSDRPGQSQSHDDAEATRRISGQLSRYAGREVTLTPAGNLPDAVSRALREFDQTFGGHTVVFRNETPDALSFDGVTVRDGTRFVNEDAEAPLLTVTAHEMLHQMRRDRPDLYEELESEIRRQGRVKDYGDELRRRATKAGDDPAALTDRTIHEELTADAVGDALTDPEFLEDLAQRNPSFFRRIATYVLDSLRAMLSRLRNLGSSRYLRDVKAFRDRLADVLERYADGQRGEPSQRAEPAEELMFSRKPSSEALEPGDMPARRPGESQADYTRRVMRRNRDEIRQAVAVAKQQRTIGRQEFRAMLAKQARASDIADRAFAEARKMFDRSGDVVNLATIDEWETGRRVTDPDARDFFNTMQEAFDQRIAKIQQLAPNAMQQLIDHYFPHIWEDSAKALKWYQAMSAKRPLEGNKSFLKQRTWGTIREGMASGLKPVSTNPVDLVMLKLGQMDKFIAFHEFREDLQRRGWLKKMDAGERVPLGYARIDDPAFSIAGGLQGYYAVPELIAKDMNNYLSPSLYRFGAWKALRAVQNVLMSARLGWSMFHAGFTTTDNLVMHADVAARRFLDGDIRGGLTTLLKTPLTVVWSPIEGHRLNREWLGLDRADTHTAAVLDMLEQGGARRTMSSTEYQNALPKVLRAVRRRAMGDTLKEVLPAVGEASSWVIHHWLVPNQKMAARVMLAKFELDRLAGALGKERGDYAGIIDAMHPDVLKQIAGNVVNVVDDRLGQMTYDNQFWNKTAREVSQAFIGAVGWQVGTVRTVTGGVRDLAHLWSPEKLVAPLDKAGNVTDANLGRVSGRLTYLVSLALIMGGLGALTQYLMTGEGPQELKDYFFPKTGRKNDDGSDERLQYPSYWMDHYKLATHPLQTAMHKVHPSLGMFMEAWANQDYFGTLIRNPKDPWWKQAEQIGEYAAKGFLPYSWTGHQQLQDANLGAGRQVANFFGVTKAPSSVSRTPFQAFVAEKAAGHMQKSPRTQDQAEASQKRKELVSEMRRGQDVDLDSLTPKQRRRALRDSRMEVPAVRFSGLTIAEKLDAYDLATPEERDEYKLRDIILRSNWHQTVRDLSPGEREELLERINAIAR